jgi:glycine/D-amino acid oxidase-like deaminating enzyme
VRFAEGAEGLFAPGDRWLVADRLAHRLAHEIERLGGEVRENSPVTKIECHGRSDPVVTVSADAERFAAATLVLAAGPSTAEIVAMVQGPDALAFPVGRVPGLLVTTPPDKMRDLVRHVLYAPDSGEFHIRPTADGGLMLGSDDIDEMIDETSDGETLQAATRALLERGRHYLPELSVDTHGHDVKRQIGVRPMPRDGRTIAGPLPGVANCYVIATHSGITLAPLLGELIAEEIVSGEVSPLLGPFRPDRFDRT